MQDCGGATKLMPGSVVEDAVVVVGSTMEDRNKRAQLLFATSSSVPNKTSDVRMVETGHISIT